MCFLNVEDWVRWRDKSGTGSGGSSEDKVPQKLDCQKEQGSMARGKDEACYVVA